LLLAAVTGVLFVVGMLVWIRAIQAAGLALSVVAMRTAVVVPLFASVVIWHERPSPLEFTGSLLSLLALSLVLSEVAKRRTSVGDEITAKDAESEPDYTTKAPSHQGGSPAIGTRHSSLGNPPLRSPSFATRSSLLSLSPSLLWLAFLFLTEGLVLVPALVFRKQLPRTEGMPFQTVIFVTAFFVTTLLYYVRRPRLSPETLKWGALLGAANLGNYLFLVLALMVLPGLAVYPAVAAGEVGLMAVAGVVLWKEEVGVRSWLGIALTVLALVLIQLGETAGT